MIFLPFSAFIVQGNSMLPTLKQGQKVLCFNWAYLLAKPKVGDLIAVKLKDKEIVKRIVKIEKGSFFLEGDNKVGSTDSRDFGPIKRSQIIGKIIL